MKNQKAFSLVELLVCLVIAAVLILTVGAISSIANSSYNKINSQQQIYNDISYGFKLLQFKVRNSTSAIASGNQPSPWISGQHFLIGSSDVFGLQTSGSDTNLVYDNGNTETILNVPAAVTTNCSNLTTMINCINLTFPVSMTAQSVTFRISGVKDKVRFDMQTTVLRRNQ